MRAVILQTPLGATENMEVRDIAAPSPASGEVLVRVAYGGCNFADTMMRRGTYPHPKGYPLVAGIELSGEVIGLGAGVADWKVGDRVAAFCEEAGAFAEQCVVPVERLVRIPDAMSLDVAAAFLIQGLTAWHLLHTVSKTSEGDLLLVHAIGGGVGLYLTQLGLLAKARVIGTVGTRGKEQRALDYGAERVINRNHEDFAAAVRDFTQGRGIDKVIDSTGGSILDSSFDLLRNLGHVVSYGEAEAAPFANLWQRLVSKSLTFTRLHIGHIDPRSEAWHTGIQAVTSAILAGTLNVPIEGIYPLHAVHAMYNKLESRQVAGKLLLQVNHPI
jgi:NADPH2:quinone reductase